MQNVRDKKQPLIRIDAADKVVLDKVAAKTGESTPKLLHRMVSRLKSEVFFEQMNQAYSNLRQDQQGWEAELEDRNLFSKSLMDGLE